VIAAASTFAVWLLAAALLGLGTAMVYPTLLAAVADVATPSWRGAAVGVYRLWRDLGFAAGAIVGRSPGRSGGHAIRDQRHRGPDGRLRDRRPRSDARDPASTVIAFVQGA
jgi:hypothetical protein